MRPLAPLCATLPLLAAAVMAVAAPPAHAAAVPAVSAPTAAGPPGSAGVAHAAAPVVAARADLGTPTVRSRTVQLGPGPGPWTFTVPCAPGEQLLSGGHGGADREARVIASHPSDAQGAPAAGGSQPRAWTVSVLGVAQRGGTLRVSATCLAGGEVTAAAFASPPAAGAVAAPRAECPSGMVRSGGGYAAPWQARLGAAAVSGSHPVGERGWAVDAELSRVQAPLRATGWMTVYVVCLSGPVQPVVLEDVPFNLDTLAGECVPGIAANVCVVPLEGTATSYCPPGSLASGGGFQAADTAPPRPFLVVENGPSANATWTVRVSAAALGGATPVRMRLTPVCLFPVAAPDGPVDDLLPDRGATRNKALAVGGGLLVLLVLLALLAVRRARRRTAPPAGVEIVVRTVRTRYRTDAYREDV
ncbi:hypothetical protein [Catellatospora sp. NPDC049609]|uniref:hypothetical protein n=1 Tax=Catellatospora sp. NPDC049609 TaxID=3155505 RepID=UPI0034398A0D